MPRERLLFGGFVAVVAVILLWRFRQNGPWMAKEVDLTGNRVDSDRENFLPDSFRKRQRPHEIVPEILAKPSAVFVFGFHHSGTSILTGTLMQLGLEAGPERELMMLVGNPVKYFELRRAVSLNEAFMDKSDRGWAPNWPHYGYEWEKASAGSRNSYCEAIGEITNWLDEQAGPSRSWVLKDPRLCLAAKPYLETVQRPAVCVLTAREPALTAARLHAHYLRTWPIQAVAELWEEYTVRAVAACLELGVPIIVNDHEHMMQQPYDAAKSLHARLVKAGVQGISLPSFETFQQHFLVKWFTESKDAKKPVRAPSLAQNMKRMEHVVSRRAREVFRALEHGNVSNLPLEYLETSSWTIDQVH